MKIFQTNFTQMQPVNYQIVPYRKSGLAQDTFTKTTNVQSPSFKALNPDVCQRIIKNPKELESFMAQLAKGLTAGLVALYAGATIKDKLIDKQPEAQTDLPNGNIITNLFEKKAINEEENNEYQQMINEYISENEQLKAENKKLKEENQALKNSHEEHVANKIQEQEEVTSGIKSGAEQDANIQVVKVNFPRKGHRLTTYETKLSLLLEKYELPQNYAERLQDICKKLFGKESYMVGGKVLTTKDITPLLYMELNNTQNDTELIKGVIDQYDACLKTPVENNEEEKKNPSSENETNEVVTESDTNKDSGVKILGTIDLSKFTPTKDKLITRDENGKIKSMYYKQKGTSPQNSAEQLDKIYQFFVRTIYNDYKKNGKNNTSIPKPMWLYHEHLPQRVRKTDIKNEIIHQKKFGKPECQYKYIVNEDYQFLADVINSDVRYFQMFDIHSALRLIDRYVKLDDENIDVAEQSRQILDKLFSMIQQKSESGMNLEVYEDGGKSGLKIVLKAEEFDEEAIDLFGPSDLVIGLIERQDRKSYRGVDSSLKESLISTIYSINM